MIDNANSTGTQYHNNGKRTNEFHIAKAAAVKFIEESTPEVMELCFSKMRTRKAVDARQAAYRKLHEAGFPSTIIGQIFSRHHSTILHALKKD